MAPRLLDLPGPSRRIRIEPLQPPRPRREPEPAREPVPSRPDPEPAPPAPEPAQR